MISRNVRFGIERAREPDVCLQAVADRECLESWPFLAVPDDDQVERRCLSHPGLCFYEKIDPFYMVEPADKDQDRRRGRTEPMPAELGYLVLAGLFPEGKAFLIVQRIVDDVYATLFVPWASRLWRHGCRIESTHWPVYRTTYSFR